MIHSGMTFLALLTCSLCVAEDVVEVDGGRVSGTLDEGVRCFRGIPFAAPPVGELRWRTPRPVADWDGVQACDSFGPICPQPGYPTGSFYKSSPQKQDEDCLYLNVWTPAKDADEKLPVMVWIHGGAWTRGSGSLPTYNGASLTRRGVVVVTINYRLGPLGFFAHPQLSKESEQGVSGNYGILDQVAALNWVQRNIASFGGDSERVTIFGESAGSWSVNVLVATPLAKGLFHRAIGQSGSRFGPAPYLKDDPNGGKTAHEGGIEFARALGTESLAQLRKLSAEEILKTRFATHLTVDGWAFPDSIRNIFASGQQNKVPTIVGSNADEMTTLSNPATVPKTQQLVTQRISARFGEDAVAKFKEVYNVVDDMSARRAFLHARGDEWFAIGMRQWARFGTSSRSDAWLYYFTRVPPGPGSNYRGAYHAAEIVYVFDNLHRLERTAYVEEDRNLANSIASYWVNFAKTGNPNGEGLPEWPAYNQQNEYYIDLGDSIETKQHLLKARLDFLAAGQTNG